MSNTFSSLCVYCGSNTGVKAEYHAVAQQLGQLLAARNIRLVYGGGKVGLMGLIADATLAAGGTVCGVIPHFLQTKEVGHDGLSEMIVTETMHERKQIMLELSDGFVAMPGGYGTLDELCEILTWSQLGIHQYPIGLLNVAGYYDPLLQMVDHMVGEQFLRSENRGMLLSATEPEVLLAKMEAYEPQDVTKWLTKDQS